MAGVGRQRQAAIFTAGFGGRRPRVPVAADRLERAALARMGRNAAAYVAGGAGLERTAAANRAAFDHVSLLPRVLRDVAARDLSIELFGRTLPLPILLAPIGVLDLVHPLGDLAAAAAAAAEGIPFITSTQACAPMEDIARAGGTGPRWFQLYWSARDDMVDSFVCRAELSGHEAIVVTLDTTLLGWRPRDLDRAYLPFLRGRGIANYVSDPVFTRLLAEDAGPGERPAVGLGALLALAELLCRWPGRSPNVLASARAAARAVQRFIATYSRPDLSWDDLARLRGRTRLPIVLKGVLHPEDAARAVIAGMDAIVVSNHGGRQVDGAVAALDALPGVVAAVGGRLPVLFDSGVRTGADIVKALALGARAVLVGRPYVYGLALAGETGVREVIGNLAAELDLTLGLAGLRSLRELDRTALRFGGRQGG